MPHHAHHLSPGKRHLHQIARRNLHPLGHEVIEPVIECGGKEDIGALHTSYITSFSRLSRESLGKGKILGTSPRMTVDEALSAVQKCDLTATD